ncbi:SOS response-associated peptidase [Leucobacter allii]|uniref:SOS response-associated peptidase n=1 Tax=Leucobacter allii TaxID=2932247 RepID=A0ABY4FP73_9MICO|nr:SOS response-associated peptidase family protein [Leucobacter allii]UOQ58083.1 SOS response-associated peptidase [Leucobacter allii]
MCASYGLDGSGRRIPMPDDLPPMSEQGPQQLLAEWAAAWGGKANTSRTRKDGRTNLNPIIWQDADGERRLDLAWWWLHVGGQPAKYTAFNSRDDALMSKWRKPFQHRAILPANWYAEGGKIWRLPDGELFGMAAIMAPRTVGNETTISYSLVTRAGVGEAATVITSRGDSRMPLVLPRDMHDDWLDPERPGDAELVTQVQHGSDEISRALTAA